jgi:streptomycin 6-kinase
MVRQRAELLGSLCDVDPEAIWQWGFIERVSTGLVCMQQIDPAHGRGFLEVAARSS